MGVPPRERRNVGAEVERRVAVYFEQCGYEVVDRNFLVRGGELDLVLRNGEVLVFCEVRSRAGNRWGTPAESIGPRKIRRVVLAARHWLARHGDGGLDLRFDVVSVVGPDLEHLEGAFEAGV